MKNRVYQRQIINGQEVMVLIEEYESDPIVEEQPTIEVLQQKIEELQTQITDVQQQLNELTNNDTIIF